MIGDEKRNANEKEGKKTENIFFILGGCLIIQNSYK